MAAQPGGMLAASIRAKAEWLARNPVDHNGRPIPKQEPPAVSVVDVTAGEALPSRFEGSADGGPQGDAPPAIDPADEALARGDVQHSIALKSARIPKPGDRTA